MSTREFRPQPAEPAEEYPGDMVSLHTLKAAARRRRRLWITTAVLGLVIGAGLHLVIPKKYSASTDLYIVEPAGSDPQQAMATDASLLQTRTVAGAAIAALHLHTTAATFLKSYRSAIVSNSLMSITTSGPTADAAISRDRAIAAAFLAFRSKELETVTGAEVDGLQALISEVQVNLNRLDHEISSLPARSADSSNKLSNLVNQQDGDISQVSQLEAEIQQDHLAAAAITQGSRVLDPAAVVPKSAKRLLVEDGLSGLVGGLGLGLVIIVVGAMLTDHLRRRADVAAALGVSVELSVGGYRPPRVLRRRRQARQLTRPPSEIALVADRLHRHLGASLRPSLVVVAVNAEEPAALALGVLAYELAIDGRSVGVADLTDNRPLVAILGAASRRTGRRDAEGGPARGEISVIETQETGRFRRGRRGRFLRGRRRGVGRAAWNPATTETDFTLVLVTVDPAIGADHLASWAADSVAVVSAGAASAARLRTTGHLLAVSGVALTGAILVGMDRADESLGTVQKPPALGDDELSGVVARMMEW